MSDKSEVHLEYEIYGERDTGEVSPGGNPCIDEASMRVHQKEDAEAMIAFLRERKFAVKMWRKSATPLVNEDFPSDSS